MEKLVLNTSEDFANALHITHEGLRRICKKPKYKTFKIAKKNGGYREISAPSYELKILQKWILVNILEKQETSKYCTAFCKNKNGLKENAVFHKEQKYLLEIDLMDFYPSISKVMVANLFRRLGYTNEISQVFTSVCTFRNKLPQGGITSPCISNLVTKYLDEKIADYCSNKKIIYSRYADDLTFSSNNLAILRNSEKEIINLIQKNSRFKINESKTRLLTPNGRKQVTGININNNEIKVEKKIKRKIRAIIYHSLKNERFIDDESLKKLLGYISFVSSIEEDYREKCINYIKYLIKKHNYSNSLGLIEILEK